MAITRFNVDRCESDQVFGWIDQTGPTSPLTIEINGEWVCDLSPTQYRVDLEEAGIGDGKRGFAFPLAGYLSGPINKVSLILDGKEIYSKNIIDYAHFRQWAQSLSDDEWCQFLAGTPMHGLIPPPLPPEEFQAAWVGGSGIEVFRHAMAFCKLLKSTLVAADFDLGPESRLLDIGVGWGRIYRVLLRETANIIGIDPVPYCIELCTSALPGAQFEISPAAPPYRFSDGEFDVVYLYSVFSHVNEELFLDMLHEATRVVREGGFVVFTTISPTKPPPDSFGFPTTWRADAEAGRFVWVPTGGGHESMPESVWGWAILSEPYLRRIISDFPLRLVAYEPDRLMQAFVALKKQSGKATASTGILSVADKSFLEVHGTCPICGPGAAVMEGVSE
jgi:ubiquinone/menaquinone biosynthesis C-methylase UbiE